MKRRLYKVDWATHKIRLYFALNERLRYCKIGEHQISITITDLSFIKKEKRVNIYLIKKINKCQTSIMDNTSKWNGSNTVTAIEGVPICIATVHSTQIRKS